jgi:hypothetical protein
MAKDDKPKCKRCKTPFTREGRNQAYCRNPCLSMTKPETVGGGAFYARAA